MCWPPISVSFVAEPRTTRILAVGREWWQPARRHPYQWIWPCSGHFPFTDAAATPIHSRCSGMQFGALLGGFARWWKWMGNRATELSPKLYRIWTYVYHHISGCFIQSVRAKASNWTLVSILYRVEEWVELYLPFPHTPSLRIQELLILRNSYLVEDPVRAVGWDIALQAGRSRVRFSKVSSEFFIHVIFPAAVWPWGRLSLYQKWVTGIFPGGKDGRCLGLTTLVPSCADCLEI